MRGGPGDIDPYFVLGVHPDVSQDKIQVARDRLLQRWHPSRNPDQEDLAAEQCKQIRAAYGLVGAPQARAAFDAASGRNASLGAGSQGGGRTVDWKSPLPGSPTVRVVAWDATDGPVSFRAGRPFEGSRQAVPLVEGRGSGLNWLLAIAAAFFIVTGPAWVYWISRRTPGHEHDIRRPTSIVLACAMGLSVEALPAVGVFFWASLFYVVLRVTRDAQHARVRATGV